jgi:cyclic pyranopterin phosphate synthase
MPAEGVAMLNHNDILSFDEIAEIVHYGVEHGVRKVRLTGGEPLIRKGIVNLVSMLSAIRGLDDLSLTTNGILLPEMANDLRKAGLKRVNISLDTLDPEKFASITRKGNVNDVLQGINAAIEAELLPVKLNCVISESSSEPDALMVKQFASEKNIEVRFIHLMNLETGEFSQVEGGEGGYCNTCNRLRLTAHGLLKPCLFSNEGFSVRELGIAEAYRLALKNKPESGSSSTSHNFYNIGG